MPKHILVLTSGTNILEMHTAAQHAIATEPPDKIFIVFNPHSGGDSEDLMKRLASHLEASLVTLPLDRYVRNAHNQFVKDFELEDNDTVRLDYTGNNKRIVVETAHALEKAYESIKINTCHTYLQTEGKTVPSIQSDNGYQTVRDARFGIEPIAPDILNSLLFNTSHENCNTPTTFEFRRAQIRRYDFIEFIPRKYHSEKSEKYWQFEHLIQVGAHQLIFFIKPEEQQKEDLYLELMQLYNRMNRIGGYSARGVLLSMYDLSNRAYQHTGPSPRDIDDLVREVVDLCETDSEKSTKTRLESSFNRYDYTTNVSAYTSRLMRPRVEVWGSEKYSDHEVFLKSLEHSLEKLL